jgi:hypothetical protein
MAGRGLPVVFGFKRAEVSQRAFECGGGFEADGLGGGDFHGFAGLRIAAGAFGAFFHVEGAESDDLDFLVVFHAFGDGGENGFEGFFGEAFGGVFPEGGLDGVDEFSFVHGKAIFWWRRKGLARENPLVFRGFFQFARLTRRRGGCGEPPREEAVAWCWILSAVTAVDLAAAARAGCGRDGG